MDFEERQAAMERWARRVLGESAWVPDERALRVAEEAIELAQALNVTAEDLHRLVDYVYSRPVGDPGQEVAGIFVTLYAAAACIGVDAEAEFKQEFARIHSPDVEEKIRRRQAEKRRQRVARPK
jgi:NTP pyrophosphatase (non-canonical NTP hydrolase)